MSGPVSHTLYEVLHILVDRVGWPDEAERANVHSSIKAAEQMNIFGNLAAQMACPHNGGRTRGRCNDCDKIINNVSTTWAG